MPLVTSTSTLPPIFMTSLSQCGEENSNVLPRLDHLYMPHGKYSRVFRRKLRCLGKGVMLRAGRATTSYLRKATFGAQAIAIVSKIWKIWDGFHKELYLYGHPLHLRPLQGLCVPSIIGVFSTSEGLANMAMEPPHPHAWRIADRSLSADEKRAIVDAYAQIHARGVLHGDVALRHMLIGRDGKPTIINFRRASCLQPAIKIGLGGCSSHEFQLEMRQVKFLLDYQDAREFEYQLARGCRSAREGATLVTPFPISEITLREWDASTLEDLPPPSLPFYVSGSPEIQIHPISWIPGDEPLAVDNFYIDSRENYAQSPPPDATPSVSCLKGKQPEHNGNSQAQGGAPTREHKQFCLTTSPTRTDGMFPDVFDLEQEHDVAGASLTLWNHFELTTGEENLEPSTSVVPGPTAIHSPHQLSSSLPLSHDIEWTSPSWPSISLMASHAPTLDHGSYNSYHSCPMEEPAARYESLEKLDYESDSLSDASNSTTHTPYEWIDSEPSSPKVFITHQDDIPPFLAIDSPGIPLLFDSPSDANSEVTRESLLRDLRPTLKTREPFSTYNKRKRLFVDEEDEHGERPRRQRRIEQ